MSALFAVVSDDPTNPTTPLHTESFASAAQLEVLPPTLVVRPWLDPVVDSVGFDPRGLYAELFWLGTVGPTAMWLLRRLVSGFEHFPDGFELDLAETAQALGLGYTAGKAGPFMKALDRCAMFGLARSTPAGFHVRRRVPPLPRRHLDRLPPHLQRAHGDWTRSTSPPEEELLARATTIARVLLSGDVEPDVVEHRLIAVGVAPNLAALAMERCRGLPEARPA